jgi:anti-sigma factor RsiW
MDCYDELTLSIACDDELPDDERRRLVAHREECPACRRLFTALQAESASLREALGEAALGPPRPRLGWGPWLAGLAAAGVGSALTLAGLDQSALPAPLAWLHPLDPHLTLTLVSSLGFYLLEEGVPTMLFNVAIVAAVAATLVLLALALDRRALRPAALAAGLFLSLATATPAQATVLRLAERGSQTVVVGAAETIDDTLIAAADTVIVEGVVKGDLIAFAREVRVDGKVLGSLAGLAKHLELNGQVDGDVYTLQESLSVRGKVGRSIHAGAKRLVLDGAGSVAHDLRGGAEEARVAGAVGRGLTLYATWSELAGKVGGPVLLRGERAAVRDSAQVGGDLSVTVPKKANAEVAAGAAIQGTTQVLEAPWEMGCRHQEVSRLSQPQFYLWQLLWLVGALVTGALLHWLAPGAFALQPSSTVDALKSMGLGFLVLFVTPIAAIVAGITVIGLPVGVITLAAWGAALLLSSVLASAWLGRMVLRRPALDLRNLLLALLVGQLILRVARPLPYVGGLVGFVSLILGLGLVAGTVAAKVRASGKAEVTP